MTDTGNRRTDLVQRVLEQKFNLGLFRPVYALDAVDLLLDDVASGLTSGKHPDRLVSLIRRTDLPTHRWKSGYSVDEVDAFLAALIAELKAFPAFE